jgi:Domain of unknown function (DUF1814).
LGNEIEVPTLLAGHLPCPKISAYPLETIIAEKLHAMAQHGYDNTRLKDYYDIWKIQKSYEFRGDTLARAIAATFEQQNRALNPQMPGLSDLFARKSERDWKAFLKKTIVRDEILLSDVVSEIRYFLEPVIEAAMEGEEPDLAWQPEKGWSGREPARSMSM